MPRGLRIRYAEQARARRTITGWISTASPSASSAPAKWRSSSTASIRGRTSNSEVGGWRTSSSRRRRSLNNRTCCSHLEAFDRQTDTLLRALAGSLEELMALERRPGSSAPEPVRGSPPGGAAQCPARGLRRRANPRQASGMVFDSRRSSEGPRGADARERDPQDRVSQRRPSRWVAGPRGSIRQSRGGRSQREACRDSRAVGQNDQSSFGPCAGQTQGSSTHRRPRHPVPPGCRRPLHRKQAAI